MLAILVVAVVYSRIGNLKDVVNGDGGPVSVFAFGFGKITESFLRGFGTVFAALLLNAFIFTALDTATRIARYITQELFRIKNRYIATLVVVSLSGWLDLTGEWNQVWPLFGVANQLIAALALIVITSWLLVTRKPAIYTIVPTIFMLITIFAALLLKIGEYIQVKNTLLTVVALVRMFLTFIVLHEAVFVTIRNYRRVHHVKA